MRASFDDFIGIFPGQLSADVCARLIEKFEQDKRVIPGETGHGIDAAKKDSLDLTLDDFPDWASDLAHIHEHASRGFLQYIRRFPHLLIGALSLEWTPPGASESRDIHAEDIKEFDDRMLFEFARSVFKFGTTNLQKYKKGSGGYHHWHSEIYPAPPGRADDPLQRVLLWMYYLNDVPEGGGTAFKYQNRTISPTCGTLVIAPAGFTHTHRGDVPVSNDKYILTSWVTFRGAQQLYGQAG